MPWYRFIFTYGERGFWDKGAIILAVLVLIVILIGIAGTMAIFEIFVPWLFAVIFNLALIFGLLCIVL